MMNSLPAKGVEYNGYVLREVIGGCNFSLENDEIKIMFTAEGRNGGTYSKVTSVWNKRTDRVYQAQRYLYKYIHIAQGASWWLADNNMLWDYVQQVPLKESREKALKPYYDKCRALGMAI